MTQMSSGQEFVEYAPAVRSASSASSASKNFLLYDLSRCDGKISGIRGQFVSIVTSIHLGQKRKS